MEYLKLTIVCLIIMIVPYVVVIIKKGKTRFPIMCIHTFDVLIANFLHVIAFNKLFNHCNECMSLQEKVIGIDFSRTENMLGVSIIDGNEAKELLVLIASIVTIILLHFANKKNTEEKEVSKKVGIVIDIVIILFEMFMSLAVNMG